MTATTLCKHVTSDRPAVMCFVLGRMFSGLLTFHVSLKSLRWVERNDLGPVCFRKSVGCGGPKLVRARVDVWAVHLSPGPFVRCETHTRGDTRKTWESLPHWEFESLSHSLPILLFKHRVETDTHTRTDVLVFFLICVNVPPPPPPRPLLLVF